MFRPVVTEDLFDRSDGLSWVLEAAFWIGLWCSFGASGSAHVVSLLSMGILLRIRKRSEESKVWTENQDTDLVSRICLCSRSSPYLSHPDYLYNPSYRDRDHDGL